MAGNDMHPAYKVDTKAGPVLIAQDDDRSLTIIEAVGELVV